MSAPRYLAAALAYADRGFLVLPCLPHEKRPHGRLVPHGLLQATTDPRTIRRWWAAEPEANVGLRMGPESGAWALDIDPRHGGAETLDSITHAHGPLPQTLAAETGGGGWHLVFTWPTHSQLVNGANKLGSGVDVKAANSYILAAPSLHPSGNRYRWTTRQRPVDAPSWLLGLLRPPSPAPPPRPQPVAPSTPANGWHLSAEERAARYLRSDACPIAVQGSGGHATALVVARKLVVGFALDEETAFALLVTHWNPRCSPPWAKGDLRELRRKVREAGRGSNMERGYLLNAPPKRPAA